MADFPGNIKNYVTERPAVGDSLEISQHWDPVVDEIVAIETTLGTNPQGSYATVADRFNNISVSAALSDLTDVSISSPQNEEVLQYNSSTSQWENAAASSGASALQDLTNVTITSVGDGAILQYDNSSSQWVNRNGDITFPAAITATGDVTAFSDERLKSNISYIHDSLKMTCKLNGYTYIMNDKVSGGLIAQEVLDVFPEAVKKKKGYYTLNYNAVVALCVNSIRSLRFLIGLNFALTCIALIRSFF